MKRTPLMLRNKSTLSLQVGFSLVEILVGLIIGLLATLVIMQVFSVFEGQKRSTTGSSDAQTSGGIGLYAIARDLQMAGYGLLPVGDTAITCDAPVVSAAATASGVPNASPLSPVIITDGGGGASDSIAIRYGDSPIAGTPMTISAITGSDVTVDNNLGCETGIGIILTSQTTCNITTITGTSNMPASGVISLGDTTGAVATTSLACLGRWTNNDYAVNAGNLELNGDPIITGIVSIQAQYGISATANSNLVTQWKDATAGGDWDAATITTANRNRIKAVRIALVARNGLLEKEDVSATCSSYTTDAPTGVCAWSGTSSGTNPASDAPTLTLSNDADGTSWKRYRYRVFETIIPLRNVIWSKGVL
ncbi:MAG: PilW family protein [Gallionella sp.]